VVDKVDQEVEEREVILPGGTGNLLFPCDRLALVRRLNRLWMEQTGRMVGCRRILLATPERSSISRISISSPVRAALRTRSTRALEKFRLSTILSISASIRLLKETAAAQIKASSWGPGKSEFRNGHVDLGGGCVQEARMWRRSQRLITEDGVQTFQAVTHLQNSGALVRWSPPDSL
jgi:hypothetical protein